MILMVMIVTTVIISVFTIMMIVNHITLEAIIKFIRKHIFNINSNDG